MSKSEEICFKPIGFVETVQTDEQVKNRILGQKSAIKIFLEFCDALEGLEGFSHIFVLAYFNRLRPEQIGPLKVKPRGLMRRGYTLDQLPLLGAFALDSPTRPNPIGLSLVPLVKVEHGRLLVTDLDLFNGTPVLDIKPYQPTYRVENYSLPRWHIELSEGAGHV